MTDKEAMDKIQEIYSSYVEIVDSGAENPSAFAGKFFSLMETILKLTGREG